MVSLPSPRRFTVALWSLVLALGAVACGDEDRTLFACIDTVCPSPPDAGSASDAGGPSLPCQVVFLTPVATDAGSLELGARDDGDARACGESFSTNVLLASSASRVNLFVNDNPLGARPVRAGQVRFDAELGNRGQTSNTLRAEATMPDGRRCSADLGTRLFVGCPGPSCSIDAPRANRDGALNREDDSDSRATGLQTTLTVATEPENAGQNVRLAIDENFDVVPATQVAPSDGRGLATFADITLAQGDRAVRAECQDVDGLRTRSPLITWRVDTASCTLRLSQVAGGSNPITPADDIDENQQNGLDVLVRGTIEGEGCESVQIGACNADLPEVSLNGLLGADGGFILPIKLPTVTGSLELCARVKDTAGNVSTPDERLDVEVRTESPGLVMVSPAPGTRYNRSGGSGAITDLALGSQATCELDVVVTCRDLGLVDLLADGEVQASAPCIEQAGLDSPFVGRVTFSGVSLASRDDGQTTTLSARQSLPGLPAGVSNEVTVQADCNAPSCSFQSPDPGEPYLSAALDNPDANGFQTQFVVVSDAESAGQNVRLSIDGNPANNRNAPALSGSGGSVATFSDVPLSESPHEIQATCADPAGNFQSTALVPWTVDTTACGLTVSVAGGHDPIVPSDDEEPGDPGLQVPVVGQTTGSQCSAARVGVGVCSSLNGPFVDLDGEDTFLLMADVPSTAATGLRICAQVRDESGNVASASQLVNVRVAGPSVSIDLPSSGAEINDDCDAVAVAVACSEDDELVELFVDDDSQGSVPCESGSASFEVALDSKNDGSATELRALQTAQGVPGVPDSIDVFVDCEAPQPSISAPVCNSSLALIGDDVSPGTTGLQVDVTVLHDGAADVTLTIDTGTTSSLSQQAEDETSTEFDAVTLGGAGNVTLSACATDAQGNTSCSDPCPLTIVAEPTLTITSPRPPTVLTIDDDCDSGTPGMQARVRGTSNASNGTPVVVTFGASPPSSVALNAGRYSACVAAADGDDQLLTASITDGVTGLTRTTSVQISVNTSPPPAILAPTFELVGRREGTVELTWLSVLDSGGDPLAAYHLRCAQTDITTESDWTAAKVFPLTLFPAGSEGEVETDVITDFRTGTEGFCMLRGEDAYGLLGALGGTTKIENPFLELDYTGVPLSGGLRLSVAALGDINDDGFDDFGYGTQGGGAVVYFGGPDLDASPDLVISMDTNATLQTNHDLGTNVVGLGDINDDGRDDFAVTSRLLTQPGAANGGGVFVFFGRASSADWSALAPIRVAPSPGCGADLCFHSTEPTAYLGASVTSTDFNGDGEADIVIGAQYRTQSATTLVGRVYVVLGGSRLAVPSGTSRLLPTDNPDGFVIDPTTATRAFGVNVAAVGGGSDDRGDLVITARGSGQIRGEAFSVSGLTYTGPGLETVGVSAAFATGTPGAFGSPMRTVGDMNDDGLADVWISTNFDPNGISPVFLGRASGFSGVSLLGFTNDVFDNEWGSYVATGFSTELASVGDIDGNGFDDLMVAGILTSNGPGSAQLFYTDATTGNRLRSRADASFAASTDGYMTPGFVGDISGDSFRDIAIVEFRLTSPPTTTIKLLY